MKSEVCYNENWSGHFGILNNRCKNTSDKILVVLVLILEL